jgi:hypothetical protein
VVRCDAAYFAEKATGWIIFTGFISDPMIDPNIPERVFEMVNY